MLAEYSAKPHFLTTPLAEKQMPLAGKFQWLGGNAVGSPKQKFMPELPVNYSLCLKFATPPLGHGMLQFFPSL
jgi:hypothetical protein